MKIASITVYCKEGFRLNDWISYYQEYKDEVYKHIIVNNGNEEDTNQLQSAFPDSIVLFSPRKALTSAYNLGIKLALTDKHIDAIMLICNDIKLQSGSTALLYEFLNSNDKFGMVAPVLLKRDCNIIELYGANINPKSLSFIHLHSNSSMDKYLCEVQISDSVPGGMNLAKRYFYEVVGLQDEQLFMYSDEVDMGIRAKKNGFIMAATKNVKAWHQHTNFNNSVVRSPMVGFLMGRNEIYLAKKHFGINIVFNAIWFRIKRANRFIIASILKNKTKDDKKFAFSYLLGVLSGVLNIKVIPFIKK